MRLVLRGRDVRTTKDLYRTVANPDHSLARTVKTVAAGDGMFAARPAQRD
jgi:hypothetical protein